MPDPHELETADEDLSSQAWAAEAAQAGPRSTIEEDDFLPSQGDAPSVDQLSDEQSSAGKKQYPVVSAKTTISGQRTGFFICDYLTSDDVAEERVSPSSKETRVPLLTGPEEQRPDDEDSSDTSEPQTPSAVMIRSAMQEALESSPSSRGSTADSSFGGDDEFEMISEAELKAADTNNPHKSS